MIQEIYIIDNKGDLYKEINTIFDNRKDECKQIYKENSEVSYKIGNDEDNIYSLILVNENELDTSLKNIPALIIINEDQLENDVTSICNKIHENEDNQITPMIVVSSNSEHAHRVEILKCSVQYFIKKPIDEDYLYYTIINIINLLDMNRTVSPLTGLPGNVQIQAEIKKRFINKEKFVMLYIDLDNFKAYNDIYGFLQGDEIIKFTARTVLKNVHEIDFENGFVGHIGGDDFIAIISNNNYEKLCQNIIVDFDYNVLDFFTQQDIQKGYIEVENRKGLIEQYPLTSISIGVVDVGNGNFNNVLEIGEVGAQVKHLSKTIPGSTYVINKRK